MKTYILYHASCTDGLGAKYAAHKKFGEEATYYPVQYGKPLPEIEDNSEVYILDFSYDLNTLQALKSRVATLVILDHHKTAQEALKGFPGAIFDMNKSGAVLAWEYFHPGTKVPELMEYIQDRDIWTWKKPGTREVLNALKTLREDFDKWNNLKDELEWPVMREVIIRENKLVSNYEDDYIEKTSKKYAVLSLFGHSVALFNTTLLVSEVGNKVCNDFQNDPNFPVDFSIGYFINDEGSVLLSFRSTGDFDVSQFAKRLGGGGHRNAAGASISLETLWEWYKLTKDFN